ncbi:hypothetical protein GR925_38650 [Streptomyces sp. HUCO-GS316]|nr:hypothetical protein [Streptomyces sp. HUCO-GS316]
MPSNSYLFENVGPPRISLSLPEGTAEAIRRRVGKREFSAFITGPLSEHERERARRVFDEVFSEEGQWPAAS